MAPAEPRLEWMNWQAGPAHVVLADGRRVSLKNNDDVLVEVVPGGVVVHDHKPVTVH